MDVLNNKVTKKKKRKVISDTIFEIINIISFEVYRNYNLKLRVTNRLY